ncbi:MAG: 2Fe-2S iron-sulfur cluster-binding protein [Proteobacteria bacterium]|jgi:[NiFe] hydrogenase diaphorase moiety small subunit|nr:2Fe-2S iron-sulfur cluster-binding protein [Pseudomonadota bacterium]NLN62470.1 2Fe-2S iron-sulfur cluster binding domain-containing protein [Myxococcales bacterium]
MSGKITLIIDGQEIEAEIGQTILDAADAAGVYIPRLCAMKGLSPHGSCRVCTVHVNGRPQAACTQPVAPGMSIENETPELKAHRVSVIDMLFVEGNHYCMFCEKSGNCELQAVAYRLGILAPQHDYMFPCRGVDASHPEVFIDGNRCILCGRCVRASQELDNKNVFQFVGRGIHKRLTFNAPNNLSQTDLAGIDKAVDSCPVGAILRKGTAFSVPIGQRLYDNEPIGSEIESGRRTNDRQV